MLTMLNDLSPDSKVYPTYISHISAAHDIKIFSGVKAGRVQCLLESEVCVMKCLSDYNHSDLIYHNAGKTSKYIPYVVISNVDIPFKTSKEINEKLFKMIKKMKLIVGKENTHNFFAGLSLLGKDNTKLYFIITSDMSSDDTMHVYTNPANLKATPSWIKYLDELIDNIT